MSSFVNYGQYKESAVFVIKDESNDKFIILLTVLVFAFSFLLHVKLFLFNENLF